MPLPCLNRRTDWMDQTTRKRSAKGDVAMKRFTLKGSFAGLLAALVICALPSFARADHGHGGGGYHGGGYHGGYGGYHGGYHGGYGYYHGGHGYYGHGYGWGG